MTWNTLNSSGAMILAGDIPDNVIVQANIRFFAATSRFGNTKASSVPFFDKDLLTAPGIYSDVFAHISMFVAFEEYVPCRPMLSSMKKAERPDWLSS